MSQFDSQPIPEAKPAASGGSFFSKISGAFGKSSFSAADADSQRTPTAQELARKEKELQDLEARLQRKEQELAQQEAQHGVEVKNFPPFWPLIHHDITNDIDVERRGIQWTAFMTWLGVMVCLLYNWVGAIASWIAGTFNFTTGIGNFFLAIIYLICGVPLSYILWYRPLYVAMKKQGIVSFTMFFVFYSANIAFCLFGAIAPPFLWHGYSFTGFMSAISMLTNGWVVIGIIYFVGAGLFTAEALLSIYVIGRVYAHFRSRK